MTISNNVIFLLPIMISFFMYEFNIKGNDSEFYVLKTNYSFKTTQFITLLLYTFPVFYFFALFVMTSLYVSHTFTSCAIIE